MSSGLSEHRGWTWCDWMRLRTSERISNVRFKIFSLRERRRLYVSHRNKTLDRFMCWILWFSSTRADWHILISGWMLEGFDNNLWRLLEYKQTQSWYWKANLQQSGASIKTLICIYSSDQVWSLTCVVTVRVVAVVSVSAAPYPACSVCLTSPPGVSGKKTLAGKFTFSLPAACAAHPSRSVRVLTQVRTYKFIKHSFFALFLCT